MAQINLEKVNTANNAPVGKLGIFVTPDNEAFLIDENGAVYAFGGGATSFLGLSDAPSTYVDQELKILRVNADGTGIEFVVNEGGGGSWGTIIGDIEEQSDLWTILQNAVYLTGNQTINGIKTFVSSPIVPTPTTDFQAATKAYVDAATGTASQLVTNQSFDFVTNTVTLDFIPDDMLYVGLNGQLTDEWVLVGDQLTVTNFTEGFIIVGYYKAIVIGGATVQTVTGTWIDNTDPANPVSNYQSSTLLDSNTVPFDKDYIMGLTARTGNVLFDFTNAELGATSVMPHQDLAAFTIPIEAKQISGTYDGSVLNYLDFQLKDKTIGSEVVRLTISQEQI